MCTTNSVHECTPLEEGSVCTLHSCTWQNSNVLINNSVHVCTPLGVGSACILHSCTKQNSCVLLIVYMNVHLWVRVYSS